MKRLSSNLTVILKVFLPIVYITFFGSLLIGSFFVTINDAPIVGSKFFRTTSAIVFCVFVLLIYFTIFQLKRVDADSEYIYINNYLKTFRYKWQDIAKMKTYNFGIFHLIKIRFNGKTSLGKKVTFLPSKSLLKDFMKENPDLFPLLEDA